MKAIWAESANGVIGSQGGLPWKSSEDMKIFREKTAGGTLIMGRKTWESLPRKPLPGRLNIVVTRQAGYTAEGAQVVGDMGDAFDAAFIQANTDRVDEVFVIGGAQIYAAAMTVADRLYLTEVDAAPVGDAAFPEFSEKDWSELGREVYLASEVDDHAFVFRALERV